MKCLWCFFENTLNDLENEFSKLGVEIVYFPYTKQSSSTFLRSALDKIHQEIKQL